MLKPWLASLFWIVAAEGSGFLRTVFVEYEDGTSDGHFEFGKAIGQAMGSDIQELWAQDSQLHLMEAWATRPLVETIFQGRQATSALELPTARSPYLQCGRER